MRQLRIGIVGTGMAFEQLHLPALEWLRREYRITGLCDADPDRARGWAQRLGLGPEAVAETPEALARRDDVDVIDIIVPIAENFRVTEAVARQVAGSGKGIICEKPLAPDPQQARAARDLPEKYGVPILIAEQYRYNEEIGIIRRLVEEGRVGAPLYFIQNRTVDFPAEALKGGFAGARWRQEPDFPGGMILDIAIHDIAALHHIFGPIEEAHAYGVPQEAGFAPYAVVQANLRFRSGMIGHFAFFCAGAEMQRPLIGLRIFGERGTIYLEERDAGTVNVAQSDGRAERIPYEPQQGFVRELLNMHRHLTEGEALASPPEIEFGDFQAVWAILRSAEEGRPIPVEEALPARV